MDPPPKEPSKQTVDPEIVLLRSLEAKHDLVVRPVKEYECEIIQYITRLRARYLRVLQYTGGYLPIEEAGV